MIFFSFAYDIGEGRAGFNSSLCTVHNIRAEFQKETTVAVGLGIWHSMKRNFGHGKCALWSEGIRDGNVD